MLSCPPHHSPDRLKVAALKFLQPVPLCSVYGRRVFQKSSLSLPDRGGSLKRLHRPDRFKLWLHGFKGGNQGSGLLRALMSSALKGGLMKPRMGFTPVTGEDKPGGGQVDTVSCKVD
jgi:hypothetical protein